MTNSKNYLQILILVCMTLIVGQSCTKTETIPYEEEDGTRILSYRISNSTQELSGAIDQTANTVTIYIPYYSSLDYLFSEITLDEGAILLDSLGNEIDIDAGPEPIAVGADPVSFAVQSATGNVRNYSVIQKVLPHQDTLAVLDQSDEAIRLPIGFTTIRQYSGNFNSLSMSAVIKLTNKETGVVYDNYFTPTENTVRDYRGGNLFTIRFSVSPEAIAGNYEAEIEHMGRTAKLSPINLYYNTPGLGAPSSTTNNYSPGDTVEHTYERNGVLVGLKRLYMKIEKGNLDKSYFKSYPATFTDDLFGKEIELKIVDWNRSTVRYIFPDIPVGTYLFNGWQPYTSIISPTGNSTCSSAGMGIYGDFDESSGYGEDLGLIYFQGTLSVTAKK